jgi:hypothetical protein
MDCNGWHGPAKGVMPGFWTIRFELGSIHAAADARCAHIFDMMDRMRGATRILAGAGPAVTNPVSTRAHRPAQSPPDWVCRTIEGVPLPAAGCASGAADSNFPKCHELEIITLDCRPECQRVRWPGAGPKRRWRWCGWRRRCQRRGKFHWIWGHGRDQYRHVFHFWQFHSIGDRRRWKCVHWNRWQQPEHAAGKPRHESDHAESFRAQYGIAPQHDG